MLFKINKFLERSVQLNMKSPIKTLIAAFIIMQLTMFISNRFNTPRMFYFN